MFKWLNCITCIGISIKMNEKITFLCFDFCDRDIFSFGKKTDFNSIDLLDFKQKLSTYYNKQNARNKLTKYFPILFTLLDLFPPCRGEIHGRQLRNNAKLTQPRARTNRYACSPIPYYVELINNKLP